MLKESQPSQELNVRSVGVHSRLILTGNLIVKSAEKRTHGNSQN
ncbi:hypothetical protein J2T13_004616 [Paenibacillus sp. DS2015]